MTRASSQVISVRAPLQGWCADLDDNPDPVFSGRMLGDGVSIDPTVGELRAPFAGKVLSLPDSRHAVTLQAENGAELLIHIGVDTVAMKGSGFTAHVKAGDDVEVGQLLVHFDLDQLVQSAASLRTPVLLLQSEHFECDAYREQGPVGFEDEVFTIRPVAEDTAQSQAQAPQEAPGEILSRTVVVGLEHGIHARPAATLIQSIAGFQARVTCTKEGDAANARSPVALMSLGVAYGDSVTVSATGPEARAALDAFVEQLDAGEPRADAEPEPSVGIAVDSPEPLNAGEVLAAQAASPGLASGAAFVLQEETFESEEPAGTLEQERARLDQAIQKVSAHLLGQSQSASGAASEIANAHLALLQDPMLADAADELLGEGASAASAWQRSVEQAVDQMNKLSDPRMRERIDDLMDINLRMQRALAGRDPGQAPEVPSGVVLLADNLLPSQLLELSKDHVHAIVLAGGGATSHVAILAVSLEIPMLVAAGARTLSIEDGQFLLVDAELGELHHEPSSEDQALFKARSQAARTRTEEEIAQSQHACNTRDGTRIHFHANIGSASDARAAVAAGAEGCGLLRTEFAFMGRSSAPGVEEQLATYTEISKALGDKPMVVRTLDAGGDKPIAYVEQKAEENPALGVRGIRLGLSQPDLLETQLSALLQLRHARPVQVMIPMVSSVSEVQAVRDLLDELGWRPGQADALRLGVMIETPAAALIADQLAQLVDFFSVGTNDLTQYTLCMDRGEPALAASLDTLHPAVLKLIGRVVEVADRAGIEVAVCGGAAADLMAAPVLLGLGVRHLSMPGSLIARQKAHLRGDDLATYKALAEKALDSSTARANRAMMRDFVLAATAQNGGD